MKDKVSIYIPAFNAEKTIEQTINSIKYQSIKVNEIIVVDDGSSDNTLEIIKKHSDIKIIINQINKGLGYSRNIAIKESKNEIIAAIDADVVLDKNWLEICLASLNHDRFIMVGGNMVEKIDGKYNLWRSKYYSQNWGKKNLENPPFLFGCNTIQFKSIWHKLKGYNESLRTNGEDIDYSEKVKLQNLKTTYLADAKCFHLQDDNLKTLSNRIWRYHSFGYKIKEISFYRFLRLSIKQFNFFLKRLIKDISDFDFKFILINFGILINFIKLEFINVIRNKKK